MTPAKYDDEGMRLTDCCGAHSTYTADTLVLCCKACWREVPVGQGDGNEARCVDCHKPVEFVNDRWQHVDPTASCFLYAARVVTS